MTIDPNSWTQEEVEALTGRSIRFHRGNTGRIVEAIGMMHDDKVFAFAVKVTPDGGQSIILNKADAQSGDWAFDVLD